MPIRACAHVFGTWKYIFLINMACLVLNIWIVEYPVHFYHPSYDFPWVECRTVRGLVFNEHDEVTYILQVDSDVCGWPTSWVCVPVILALNKFRATSKWNYYGFWTKAMRRLQKTEGVFWWIQVCEKCVWWMVQELEGLKWQQQWDRSRPVGHAFIAKHHLYIL